MGWKLSDSPHKTWYYQKYFQITHQPYPRFIPVFCWIFTHPLCPSLSMAPLILGAWHGIKGAEVGKNRGQHLLLNRRQGCHHITSAHTHTKTSWTQKDKHCRKMQQMKPYCNLITALKKIQSHEIHIKYFLNFKCTVQCPWSSNTVTHKSFTSIYQRTNK